jgi:asparagine N-glycosylation enzyme membrane subunit Stt3
MIRGVKLRLQVAAACLLGALLAWHRHATVLSESGGRFEDPDAMFHARRAMRAVAEGTLLPPATDRFENFPEGGRALWPPLHDATLALLARAGGSTREEPARGMTTAAALPVLELVLVVIAAAAIARRLGGGAAGAAAAAFTLALTAAVVRRAAFGEIDHNLTEVLFGLWILYFVSRRISSSEREQVLTAASWATGLARDVGTAVAWAALVLVSLGFYTGLVMSAGVVGAAACAAAFFEEKEDGRFVRLVASLALGFALAAATLPFFAALRVKPDPADPWRLGPVYTLLLCAAAIGSASVSLFLFLRRSSAPPRRLTAHAGLALGALVLAAAAAAAQPRAAWGALVAGLGFVGARDPWLATIDEFRPMWTSPLALLGSLPAVPVGLVALFLAARAWRKLGPERRAALVLASVPALVFLALALSQKRFLPPASAFLAAAAGAAWAVDASSVAVWARRAVFAASALVMLDVFGLTYLGLTFKGEPDPLVSAGEAAAGIVRDATPLPGDPPAWGVLAPWDYGHEILRYSGRAVALNNFGTMQPGFARAMGVFLETDAARAVAELDALRLRFVVVVYPPNVVPGGAQAVHRDPARYFAGGYDADRLPPYAPTEEGARTFLVRLHLEDGAPKPTDTTAARAALQRLALLWESPQTGPDPTGRPVPFMKLFEVRPAPAP